MLIRVSGAIAGIKEYLENGRKDGREFSRNELDERLVIDGDLEMTDAIINSMGGSGEKYLHITMSFKEDEISPELLREITAEFKAFAFSAYQADEFNFYAEAHLPRIKSYVHNGTGELVERKPHIHIVIPEINLLSGNLLNPFGKVDQQTKFLEAIQEHLNAKHGLASPKDHRRTEITNASEMISRYKGDIFEGNNAELKNKILGEVLSRRVQNYDDFKGVLAEFGEMRSRNPGKPSEYQNVKPSGAAKGVNLKEFVFSREFIELDDQAKRARLAADVGAGYQATKDTRPTDRAIAARLKDWHEVRSREIKYLNSGNRKAHAAYRAADPDQRRAILAEREAHFYAKHRKEDPTHEQRSKNGRSDPYARSYPLKREPGAERRQPDPQQDRREAPPQSINRVRGLSSLGVVRFAKGSEVLLPSYAPDHLEHHGAERTGALRRLGDSGRELTGEGRDVDNVVGQLAAEDRERKASKQSQAQPDITAIRREIDARKLLDQLSQSHGLQPEKYSVSKAKDGSDRIKCGTRNLNVSDFLTKEMNLPWKDAEKALRECHAAQRGNLQTQARSEPRRELWQQYRSEGKPALAKQRGREWEQQRASEKERRVSIKADFLSKRGQIQGDRAMKPAERKAALSVARMARVQAEQTLRERIKAERAELKAAHAKPHAEQYRDFLTEKAQAGDEAALAELRRQRKEPQREEEGPTFKAAQPTAAPAARDPLLPQPMRYTVARNGDVTYHDANGQAILRDAGREVRMLKVDDKAIETGLRLAVQKFGPQVNVNGDEVFKRRVVELSVTEGIKVEFKDPALNRYRAELEEAQRAGREYLAQQRAAAKAEAQKPTPKPEAEKDQALPLAVAGSKLAKGEGAHKGEVLAVDERYVYQQTRAGVVHHPREQFNAMPQPGEKLVIKYQAGRVQSVQDIDRGPALGR